MIKKVTVLGEGAWGSALALLFARNGYDVVLWCHNEDVAHQIQKDRINQTFFPGVFFDESIYATTEIDYAMRHAMLIVEAVPVAYLRSVVEKTRSYVHDDHIWIITSKGIEQDTLKLPSQIISSVLGDGVKRAVVLGPTFAVELAAEKLSAFDIAATDPDTVCLIQNLFGNKTVSCFLQTDFIGMQLCSAMKNLIAIGMGLLKQSECGENACALFFTRIIREIADLIVACKGSRDTLFCVSGIGDIMLTSLGSHSKNMRYGVLLAKGHSRAEIAKIMNGLPEGDNTALSVQKLATQKGVSLPLCRAISYIVQSKADVSILQKILICSERNQKSV